MLKIQSEDFARSLESQPTIADASVTVRVQERVPVAINITKNQVAPNTGLIAEDSLWMPIHSDAAPNSTSFQMPNLKVLGQVEQCQSYWHELYKASSYLQVKVSKIDCQDPYNLILKTELGDVHLGPYSSLLAEQMRVLQKMHRLLTQVPISQIVYIDLSNPTHPLIQTKVVP